MGKVLNQLTGHLMKVLPLSWQGYLSIVKHIIFDGYSKKSFSGEGEDIIVNRLLKNKRNGFYVDVGANHPYLFSNTYFFYRNNWKGINIDATPGSMKLFNLVRRRDINIEAAISDKKQKLTYFMFNISLGNTFDEKLASERQKGRTKLIGKKIIETERLDSILNSNLPHGQKIDLMSVDVEGHELNVLKSNNWEKYSPSIIAVEFLDADVEDVPNLEVYKFLKGKGYKMVAKTRSNLIFTHKNFKN